MDAASCVLVNSIRVLKEKYNNRDYLIKALELFPSLISNVDIKTTGSTGLIESIFSAYQILYFTIDFTVSEQYFIPIFGKKTRLIKIESSIKLINEIRKTQMNRISTKDLQILLTSLFDSFSLLIRKSDLKHETLSVVCKVTFINKFSTLLMFSVVYSCWLIVYTLQKTSRNYRMICLLF